MGRVIAFVILLLSSLIIGGLVIAASKQISREQAIAIASQDAGGFGGFLGTWVNASLQKNQWLITATSKSAHAPAVIVIDSTSGKVLYKSLVAVQEGRREKGLLNSDHTNAIGKALDAPGHATVVTDNNVIAYIEHLNSWAKPFKGKRVMVTGRLTCKKLTSEPNLTNPIGADAEEVPLVMERAEWALEK